jgi:hypothetical protein
MPRIREIMVSPFNQTQDIPDDRRIVITGNLENDLSTAVERDYCGGIDPDSSDMSCSDIYQCWEHVSGAVSAGMLSGATECAHVDAVLAAYRFSYGALSEDNIRSLARFHDPYSDPEWREWHLAHGTACPACEATNYDAEPSYSCGNCAGSLAEGYPAGAESEDLSELVFGYVAAATWTDLQIPCERCEGSGERVYELTTSDGYSRSIKVRCALCEGSGGAAETGSDPYQYGPDDIAPDVLAEIRSDCSDFLRANLDGLREYVERMGPMIDHPQAAGGARLGERECSAMERAGHDLYMTAYGHGVGFWDRGLGELGERLSESARPYTPPNLYLDADSGMIYS